MNVEGEHSSVHNTLLLLTKDATPSPFFVYQLHTTSYLTQKHYLALTLTQKKQELSDKNLFIFPPNLKVYLQLSHTHRFPLVNVGEVTIVADEDFRLKHV